jgi:FkbM family methyltransferase
MWAGVWVLLAIASVYLLPLATDPKVDWRYKALALKAGGDISELSWAETLVGVTPLSWRISAGLPALHLVHIRKQEGDGVCPSLWRTPTGSFWGRPNDHRLLENLIAEQLLERIYDRPPVTIRRGDTVVDVGAHLGTFTRLALLRGARRVVAFEPEPTNIECFKKTFGEEIDAGTVMLIEAAAWEKREELHFDLSENDPNTGMGRVRTDGRLTVQGVTIDETLRQAGVSEIHFVKMDIEGAERHALAGASETIARDGPRMALCTYHRSDDQEVIPRTVQGIRGSYQIVAGPDQAYFFDMNER